MKKDPRSFHWSQSQKPMKKLKVMSVVGTQPEIIRLARVIAGLDEHCDHILVHTGQNYDYELSQVFFDELGVVSDSGTISE
jgi:UDP-N-acetylglucosamine 2-epimerase (non-hydrolysing)